ncbi:glycosyltransferase family 4 protein [Ammonicoccus fulvus]|uniref:Glycosyltransferase family 4 protein n=1 Tax=Ammonicoccus fulvus TaxID=3138240 RepID=A0ABZ3FQL4_9ACTN
MATTLVITNDFPPRIGGIEAFVAQVCDLLGDVVVLTSSHPDAAAADAGRPYPIHRGSPLLLPGAATLRAAVTLMERHGATRIVFGAAAPLGLLAAPLRAGGATHLLAISHGHETWWARTPGARRLLRRIGDTTSAVSWISGHTRDRIAPALSPAARARMIRLAPPVATDHFAPAADARPARPTVISAGRFVSRKGFDTLLEAWAGVLRRWPAADLPELVLVGDGPQRRRLETLARGLPAPETVRFTGGVPHHRMPEFYARGHLFAMPVRPRWGGLDAEGLGMVYAEAAACGLAVVAGDSGGTRDTMIPGESGVLVPPNDPAHLTGVLLELLLDLSRAEEMGRLGRAHVETAFSPTTTAATLRQVLDL